MIRIERRAANDPLYCDNCDDVISPGTPFADNENPLKMQKTVCLTCLRVEFAVSIFWYNSYVLAIREFISAPDFRQLLLPYISSASSASVPLTAPGPGV